VDGNRHSPGKLIAFDPVAQSVRWTIDHPLPYNGGVMATAGNLVFQGNAEGRFEAFAADTGEPLWSVHTGSAINSAPVSYSINDTQYVLIPIGAGGGVQFFYPEMHAADDAKGPTRLLAFNLAGEAMLPGPITDSRTLPEQPALDVDKDVIAYGKALYSGYCKGCHGLGAVARYGGSVPDLRYSNADTHDTWHGIVIGGSNRANGMPGMDIAVEDSEAIRNYVLSLSEEIRAQSGAR